MFNDGDHFSVNGSFNVVVSHELLCEDAFHFVKKVDFNGSETNWPSMQLASIPISII